MLTTRGKILATIAAAAALWGLWEVSAHLFWLGDGWGWCDDLLTCKK